MHQIPNDTIPFDYDTVSSYSRNYTSFIHFSKQFDSLINFSFHAKLIHHSKKTELS
ncbi:hypothetical protein ES288_A13G246700v1 [Gossypium darwinii]|uniref:Uncharacterized protein n=1 Tax=Gossypium darwinii TaxID=34276 RepID=A0A5D2E312_GOSDA|nr:hypothetical protein ES288_A13G246700v1 [Gossypium darwinii]